MQRAAAEVAEAGGVAGAAEQRGAAELQRLADRAAAQDVALARLQSKVGAALTLG